MIQSLQTELVSFGFSLLILIIGAIAQARPRLVWGKQYGFCHSLKGNADAKPTLVYTENFLIQNLGRRTATDLEIVLNYKPENYAIWEQREYAISENPEGKFVLKFKSLAPREFFSLNMLMIGVEPPAILKLRSSEAQGREVQVIPARLHPKWVYYALYALLFLGLVASIYLVITLFSLATKAVA